MNRINWEYVEERVFTWSVLTIVMAFAGCLILGAIGLAMEIFK